MLSCCNTRHNDTLDIAKRSKCCIGSMRAEEAITGHPQRNRLTHVVLSFASHVFAAQLASIHVTDSGTSSLSLDIDMDRGAGAMACAVCTVQWRWRVRGRWGVTGCVSACYGTGNTHCGFILKTQNLKRPNVNALIFCVILHN